MRESDVTGNGGELEAVFVRDLEKETPGQRWLIQDLWGRSAVGLIGGSPKVGKSWLGLDLALSVASGTPALDRFGVEDRGRALVYLAEDGLPQVRSRIESLCSHRGLEIQGLDLAVITAPILRLDTGRDQDRLRVLVERLRPRLLLLDPLVRLHSKDENSSQEIACFLSYFRDLQRSFGTAIILVHHTSKKSRARPGQSLRGSSDLHAFGDSNAYLTTRGDGIVLTLEHRSARPVEPILLKLISRDEETHLEIQPQELGDEDEPLPLQERILAVLGRHGQLPLSRSNLRSRLRVNNQRLGEALQALEAQQRIKRDAEGWSATPHHP